ncbi:DUF6907 domain-containing protein [Streptomyces sp. NPDC018833]|uniref:DUF6907 domain-containing protein n=1 Tax=Streptomyces sp. NPDC018833 TaxID=3365053 RepID=UPI00379C06A5
MTRNGVKAIVSEPSWCTADHPQGIFLADVSHRGDPIEVLLQDGTVLASAELAQWPYNVRNRLPIMSVVLDTEGTEYDDEQLQELASKLLTFAALVVPQLRVLLAEAVEEASR